MNRFFDALGKLMNLPNYLRNPQDNPQLTVIALGIILVLGLLIVSVLVLVYLRISGPKPKQSIKKKSVLKKISIKYYAVIFGILFFVILLAVTTTSRNSKFCANCHVNENIYDSWKKSEHKKIACFKCHQAPGALGYMEYIARGGANLVSFARRSWQEPLKTVFNDNACRYCHREVFGGVIESKRIKVSHKEFLQKGYKCNDCHAGIGHEAVSNPVKEPQKNQCLNCHDNKQASSKCDVCHVSDIARSRNVKESTYLKVTAETLTSCKGCHTEKTQASCIKCMGFEMPHPEGWAPEQGIPKIFNKQKPIHPPIAFKNFEKCMKCHSTENFCNNCHRFPPDSKRNHGPQWVVEHQKNSPDAYCGCHKAQPGEWCRFCHGSNFERKRPGDLRYYYSPPPP